MARRELRSIPFAPEQKHNIELKNMGDGRATILQCEMVVPVKNTTGAPVTVKPSDIIAKVAEVKLNSPLFNVQADGPLLAAIYQHMMGKATDADADVTIADNATEDVTAFLYILMADQRSDDPNHGAQDTRLIRDRNIEVRYGSAVIATDVEIQAGGNVYPVLEVTEGAGIALPAKVRIGYEDWAQKTANLPEGAYSHLFALKSGGGVLTPTDIARVRCVDGDGGIVVDSLRLEDLAQDFNHKYALGTDAGPEALDVQSMSFAPIITAPDKYKLTQLNHSVGSMRTDIVEGTATGARFGFRMVEPVQQGSTDASAALKKLGHPNPERVQLVAKTLSKTPLEGDAKRVAKNFAILPKRPV